MERPQKTKLRALSAGLPLALRPMTKVPLSGPDGPLPRTSLRRAQAGFFRNEPNRDELAAPHHVERDLLSDLVRVQGAVQVGDAEDRGLVHSHEHVAGLGVTKLGHDRDEARRNATRPEIGGPEK